MKSRRPIADLPTAGKTGSVRDMANQPKKPAKAKPDLNRLAARIVAEATGQAPKTPDPAPKRKRAGGAKKIPPA